jgi:hypothetical protein
MQRQSIVKYILLPEKQKNQYQEAEESYNEIDEAIRTIAGRSNREDLNPIIAKMKALDDFLLRFDDKDKDIPSVIFLKVLKHFHWGKVYQIDSYLTAGEAKDSPKEDVLKHQNKVALSDNLIKKHYDETIDLAGSYLSEENCHQSVGKKILDVYENALESLTIYVLSKMTEEREAKNELDGNGDRYYDQLISYHEKILKISKQPVLLQFVIDDLRNNKKSRQDSEKNTNDIIKTRIAIIFESFRCDMLSFSIFYAKNVLDSLLAISQEDYDWMLIALADMHAKNSLHCDDDAKFECYDQAIATLERVQTRYPNWPALALVKDNYHSRKVPLSSMSAYKEIETKLKQGIDRYKKSDKNEEKLVLSPLWVNSEHRQIIDSFNVTNKRELTRVVIALTRAINLVSDYNQKSLLSSQLNTESLIEFLAEVLSIGSLDLDKGELTHGYQVIADGYMSIIPLKKENKQKAMNYYLESIKNLKIVIHDYEGAVQSKENTHALQGLKSSLIGMQESVQAIRAEIKPILKLEKEKMVFLQSSHDRYKGAQEEIAKYTNQLETIKNQIENQADEIKKISSDLGVKPKNEQEIRDLFASFKKALKISHLITADAFNAIELPAEIKNHLDAANKKVVQLNNCLNNAKEKLLIMGSELESIKKKVEENAKEKLAKQKKEEYLKRKEQKKDQDAKQKKEKQNKKKEEKRIAQEKKSNLIPDLKMSEKLDASIQLNKESKQKMGSGEEKSDIIKDIAIKTEKHTELKVVFAQIQPEVYVTSQNGIANFNLKKQEEKQEMPHCEEPVHEVKQELPHREEPVHEVKQELPHREASVQEAKQKLPHREEQAREEQQEVAQCQDKAPEEKQQKKGGILEDKDQPNNNKIKNPVVKKTSNDIVFSLNATAKKFYPYKNHLSECFSIQLINELYRLNEDEKKAGTMLHLIGSRLLKTALNVSAEKYGKDSKPFSKIYSNDVDCYVDFSEKKSKGLSPEKILAQFRFSSDFIGVDSNRFKKSELSSNRYYSSYSITLPSPQGAIIIDAAIRHKNFDRPKNDFIPLAAISGHFADKPDFSNENMLNIPLDEHRWLLIEDKDKLLKKTMETGLYDFVLPDPHAADAHLVNSVFARAFAFHEKMENNGDPILRPGPEAKKIVVSDGEWAYWYFAQYFFEKNESKPCYDEMKKLIRKGLFVKSILLPTIEMFCKVTLIRAEYSTSAWKSLKQLSHRSRDDMYNRSLGEAVMNIARILQMYYMEHPDKGDYFQGIMSFLCQPQQSKALHKRLNAESLNHWIKLIEQHLAQSLQQKNVQYTPRFHKPQNENKPVANQDKVDHQLQHSV